MELVIGILGGGFVGWLTTHWYYRRQVRDAKAASAEARRIDEGFARFFEALSQSLGAGNRVAFARDEKGGVRFDVLHHTVSAGTGAMLVEGHAPHVSVTRSPEEPEEPSQ
jgi:hypothetical protein